MDVRVLVLWDVGINIEEAVAALTSEELGGGLGTFVIVALPRHALAVDVAECGSGLNDAVGE